MSEKSAGNVTLLNRGQRSYEVANGADGKSRRHGPGTTMEYSAEEAKKMAGYRDLVDISKLPGQVDVGAIKAESVRLTAENAVLKAQLQALQTAPVETPEVEEAAVPEMRKRR